MHKLPIFSPVSSISSISSISSTLLSLLSRSSLLLLPVTAAACGDEMSTISISTAVAPEAIAYRDGLDGAWRTPTPSATGAYEVDVAGPYMVTVVCSAGGGALVTTRQIARTPEDGRALTLECAEPPAATSEVKATVAQAGAVAIGAARVASETPGWALDVQLPAGTFDLIGVTADKITLRRDVAVSGTVDLGSLDLEAAGAELAPAALSAANAAAGEEVLAQVAVTTPRTSAGLVYAGDPAGALIAPTSILTADARQSVTLSAAKDDATRTATRLVRRDFHAGDAAAFTLPEPLGAAQLDAASGKLAATWTALPAHDRVLLSLIGSQADGKAREHTLELSQSFLAATGATGAALEADLPGYQAAWRLDLTREHRRSLTAVRDHDGEHDESALSELVPAGQPVR